MRRPCIRLAKGENVSPLTASGARREAELRSYNGYKHGCIDIGRPELSFDNGLGGFDKNGEYVITLEAGQSLPMPWCNVIANDTFGCIVTERGGGHTWRYTQHRVFYVEPLMDEHRNLSGR